MIRFLLDLIFSSADVLANSQTRAMRELLALSSDPRPLRPVPAWNGEEESDMERSRR